jgi:hypothetical protein
MKKESVFYVYYSYKQWGRGYIGYRKCPKNKTPETDSYLGSYFDKSFNPTEKIILFQDLTQEEAIEIEIYLHNYYNIDKNPHFANKAKQRSAGFFYDNTGKKFPEETRRNVSKATSGEKNPMFGRKHSKESRQKMSDAMTGENNPNCGKIKINNGKREKLIFPREEIPKGFFLGRLPSKQRIRVITAICCYFSIKDACEELGISTTKFYKLFERDITTVFYVEREKF